MILVVGANGFVGRACRRYFAQRGYPVIAASHRTPAEITLDLAQPIDPNFAERLPKTVTHAVLCSFIAGFDDCRRDPAATRRFNVERLGTLIGGLIKRGIVPVLWSSDAVFGDGGGPYHEADAPNPPSEYGRQKRAVETLLQTSGAPFIILRTTKLFGGGTDDSWLVGSIARPLLQGGRVRAATDQTVSPLHVDDAIGALETVMRQRGQGLFHAAPPPDGVMTRFQLALTIAQALGLDQTVIEPCKIGDFNFLEPRSLDIRLCADRLASRTGVRFTRLQDHLPAIIAAAKS